MRICAVWQDSAHEQGLETYESLLVIINKTKENIMGGRTHGKDTSIILVEIQKHHGDTLLYDRLEYKNSHTKITIGCRYHGYFEKYPNDMKNNRGGCPKCNNSYRKTHDEFIKELDALYPYIVCQDTYKNAKTKLSFLCQKHNHIFVTMPAQILSNHVLCPECYSDKQTNTKVAKRQITDPKLKTDYELYRRAVWRFSNRSYKIYLFEQKRNRHNHLDHVLSIVDGFNNNVPPEIMGSIHNLRIISGQANRNKSYRSEITVEQLLKDYNK
jgi:hypothetical protein